MYDEIDGKGELNSNNSLAFVGSFATPLTLCISM